MLSFRVALAPTTTQEGRAIGYFGAVRLEVFRSAIMLEAMSRAEVTAWEGMSLLSGPPGNEMVAVLDTLDALVSNVAAGYQKAGN
jgi:hypothetical protein